MSRYTDSGFGFSFWYPTAWKVMDKPVADPTRGGWFPDGKIIRELEIRNPAADNDTNQLPGLILDELLAPSGLTELGQKMSASPVGVDTRYFFDSGTHRWMYAQLSDAPDGSPPGNHPVEMKGRTMDGLPIFFGAERGGAEVIVPLDGSHFLTITPIDYGGERTHIDLAETVTATHPNAAQPQPAQIRQQIETVHREAVKLGAIGESLAYWYKDDRHVYDSDGNVLRGADAKTFKPILRDGQVSDFATDGVHVYRDSALVPGADPKTFAETGVSTAKDAHHIYDWSSGSLRATTVPPGE